MFVKAVYIREKKTVHYFDAQGNETLYIGGSFAWRTNNPGNMAKPGQRVVPAIGYAQRTSNPKSLFCIFADHATGERERIRLLKTKYKGDTISQMVYQYAPPHENDTEGYIAFLVKHSGLPRTSVVGDLNDAEFERLSKAMAKQEGTIIGEIIELGKPAKVALQDKLQQPLANKPIQLKSGDKKVALKTDHHGELPTIYPKLFSQGFDLFYDAIFKKSEKIGQVAADWTGKGMTLVAPYYTVTAKPGVHQSKKPLPKTFHIVKSGETLAGIAQLYGKSVDDFVTLNKLKNKNKIFDRQHLLIPGSPAAQPTGSASKPAPKEAAKPAPKKTTAKPATTSTKPATTAPKKPATTTAIASQSTQSTAKNNPVTVVSSVPLEHSGAFWCDRFKGSTALSSLSSPFKENATSFISAMQAAGIAVTKNAAFRPIERSYMMYYAFKIAKGQQDVTTVPPWPGVNIDWAHRNAAGVADAVAAKRAARAMCTAFSINPDSASQKVGKPKKSRHNFGGAIDLRISGYNGKTMKNKAGENVLINSWAKLVVVGATYNVNYYPAENMHWSDTGN